MKLAVVVGGWHWPQHLFRTLARMKTDDVDLFVIGHRSPELPVVFEEKAFLFPQGDKAKEILDRDPLIRLDRELYREAFPSLEWLYNHGWQYQARENTVGDWGFFNQWLEDHDPAEYDLILNCHDDTYIRDADLFYMMRSLPAHHPECLLWANGKYDGAPPCYVRGSFEIWRPELIRMMGGRIDLGTPSLTREGATDSPAALEDLMPWNALNEPTRKFMNDHGLAGRIGYLSPYYRISRWAIEGERGFMSRMDGAPWSYSAGLKVEGITK